MQCKIKVRLGMSLEADNVRSRLKSMKRAWLDGRHANEGSGFGILFEMSISWFEEMLYCRLIPNALFDKFVTTWTAFYYTLAGTGKTSIAKATVTSSLYKFICLSDVTAGVKDVREVVKEANKMKQDSFLPVIEDGSIVFIGAMTDNPSFHLNNPLLSKCRVLKLNVLGGESIVRLLKRVVEDVERGVGKSVGCSVAVEGNVFGFLSLNCDRDARVALNLLEIAAGRKQSEMCSKIRLVEDLAYNASSMPVGDEGCDVLRKEENGVGSFVAIVTLDDAKKTLQCYNAFSNGSWWKSGSKIVARRGVVSNTRLPTTNKVQVVAAKKSHWVTKID
ncbi:hypothetical protein IFM89_014352 [Coptis chinensis]|uniref:Uncharacterized protein n=1 Tax=Coptis chinensis TaxID=261450 RepID=A0A835IQ05_9MAGN|nr:hypothetical protein IFM89_014352 [Coptis chinensis]